MCCHHCGHDEPTKAACENCGNQDLFPLGHGTQRLETALRRFYPGARVLRIDRDSTRGKGTFASMRKNIVEGAIDIMVGTQMIAKGHDFPKLTLVGVLGADNALYSADFRATERLFALLEQVAGRAGRGDMAGEVIVQTNLAEHPIFHALIDHDFDRFADGLLEERKSLGLPPFAHLALLLAEARARDDVTAFLSAASADGQELARRSARRCQIYSPVPAALARRAGLERGQVLVQSTDRRQLQDFLGHWRALLEARRDRRVRWHLDVDPLGFT